MNLFVYGTLRKEGGLCFKMDEHKYLGTYKTEPIYKLWDCGCPCLDKGGDVSVTGEIYQIENLSDIASIHSMEVRAGYILEKIEVINFHEPTYAYFQEPDQSFYAQEIRSGDWVAHQKCATALLHP